MRSRSLVALMLVFAAFLAGCVSAPENLACRAGKEGNHLAWSAVENATHYNVYRGEAGSDFENATLIGFSATTNFLDEDVEPGVTYRYWVTAVGLVPEEAPDEVENESEPSELCDVTTIPFFPSAPALALAGIGSVLVFEVVRRRASKRERKA